MREFIFCIDEPQNFSDAEKEMFLNLLIKQNKVRNPTMDRVNRCTFLCFCKVDSEIVSIGALKPKTNSDFDADKTDLERCRDEFNLELGYCFTLPDHTGKGLSSMIVRLLINQSSDSNLMASTELREDNSMRRILEKNKFILSGSPWKSTIHGGTLGLFLKFAR